MDLTGYGGHLGDFTVDLLDLEMVINSTEEWLWIRGLKERNLLIHTWPA